MKTGLILLVLLLSLYANELLAAKSAQATSNKPNKSHSNSISNTGKLTTDAQFSDQVVNGQYQVPFEAVSTVENEKNIDSLIGVRKNFNDRIEKSKTFRDSK